MLDTSCLFVRITIAIAKKIDQDFVQQVIGKERGLNQKLMQFR